MTESLVVVADHRIMGEIQRDRRGRLTFVYDDHWRSMEAAYPLSLSMPLVVAQHEHARIEPWLWGLLPDNEVILARWGQRFHVSPRNAFALLAAVGEDCAGAVQLVRPDRIDGIIRAEAVAAAEAGAAIATDPFDAAALPAADSRRVSAR